MHRYANVMLILCFYYFHFADEETETESLNNLPNITYLSSKLQKEFEPESDFESHPLTTRQFCLPVILFLVCPLKCVSLCVCMLINIV